MDEQRFRAIMCDPPYTFRTRSITPTTRLAQRQLAGMTPSQIYSLPVGDLAAPDCALFLWATGPLLFVALQALTEWGFKYKSVVFVWVPLTALGKLHMGLGYYTRQGAQVCLLGTRGSPKRQARDVLQIITDRKPGDGGKPEEARRRIERLVAGPYLDLFADRPRDGWTVLHELGA